MSPPFLIRVAELPSVWERAVHWFDVRVIRERLSVCFFSLWEWGGMWDLMFHFLIYCFSFKYFCHPYRTDLVG